MIYLLVYVFIGLSLSCYGIRCLESYGCRMSWGDYKKVPIWVALWPLLVLLAIDRTAKDVAKRRL